MRLRLMTIGVLAAGTMLSQPVWAAKKAPTPAPAAPADAAPGAPKPLNPQTVVATVNGHAIHLSDLNAAVAELPQNMRSMPPQQLYPILVDQMIDREALVLSARKQGLQNDPAVKAAMARADDTVLQNALLRRDVAPQITEANVRAAYDKNIGTKPGEEEVQASHILVPTEAQAKDIIKQLDKGADFATLAKKYSTDPTGKQSGGDLGYFKKADMLPAFSDAAFALKPGQITQTPVHTRYGWHVIKVFNKRQAPPPTFQEAAQQLQQEMVQKLIQQDVDKAKQGLVIHRYNSDGSPATNAPDQAAPASTPAPAKKK
jgi:peptidyl-prolyl cis-trans isomerase C